MTHPNAAKGAAFERKVRDYLIETFGRWRVRRPRQAGYADLGDLHVEAWALQCKDVARLDLSGWVRDAETQRVNSGAAYAAAVVKRRQAPVSASYVVMTLGTFRAMLADPSPVGYGGAPTTDDE